MSDFTCRPKFDVLTLLFHCLYCNLGHPSLLNIVNKNHNNHLSIRYLENEFHTL